MGRIRKWIVWQRVPVERIRIDAPRRETRLALGFAVFYVLAAVGTGAVMLHFRAPIWGAASLTQDWWYTGLFKIGLLLVVPLAAFYRMGYRLADLLPAWRLNLRSGLIIVLSFLIGFSVNAGQGHLEEILAAQQRFGGGEYAARVALGFLLPLFSAGFPEEFFFRGILQTRLERVGGRAAAILVSVTLFTAWHLPTRYFHASGVEGTAGNLASVLLGTGLPVFIAGLVFALFWNRFRSLIPLIAAHWAVDTLPTISSFLGISR